MDQDPGSTASGLLRGFWVFVTRRRWRRGWSGNEIHGGFKAFLFGFIFLPMSIVTVWRPDGQSSAQVLADIGLGLLGLIGFFFIATEQTPARDASESDVRKEGPEQNRDDRTSRP